MAYFIWDILGIPPTSDKKEIKKAYARQSAACHPEEHPEEFERLYNAYKTALMIASDRPAPVQSGPEPASETAAESASPAESQPASGPADEPMVIPSISQLVDQGMAQEKAAAARKLMEKLQALHATFPPSVNYRGDELSKALRQLENLFHSQWFETAGWDPGFLSQLDQWLSRNRDTINRAEFVALFRAYHFKDFQTQNYPSSPYISNIHWEIMQLGYRYEKDMAALTGKKPIEKTHPPSSRADKGRSHWLLAFQLLILAVLLFRLTTSSNSSRHQPVPRPYDMEKIIAGLNQETGNETNPLTVLGTPSQAEAGQNGDELPEYWRYHRYYQVDRPEDKPFNPEEYEYNGKNQLTLSYGEKNLFHSEDGYASFSPLPLVVQKTSDWKIPASNSFLTQDEMTDNAIIYNMETYDEEPISFKMWVIPSESNDGPNTYRIGGCGYWAEAFLHFASKAGIEGRTWYDQDYNAHLVLSCSSIGDIHDLTERLLKAASWYYDYVSGFSPPLDLAIVYGPDTGKVLDQLQALEKPGTTTSSMVTLPEAQLLERCGPDPLPKADEDSGLVALTSFDETMRWISWAHIEEEDADSLTIYPGLPPEEAARRAAADLNGLDWVLSRFEIQDHAADLP